MRNAPDETRIFIGNLEPYKEFWNDAILVLAVPCGNVLYAQRISDLSTRKFYDVERDFERFEDIFRRATSTDVVYFGLMASQFISNSGNGIYSPQHSIRADLSTTA